jgi:uncharacterized membrane protein
MTRKPDILLIGVLLGQLACVAAVTFLAYSRHPSNHWGADVRWTYILGVVGVAYGFFLLVKAEHKTHSVVAIAASLVFVGLIYSADKFNVLVQYERWVQRGMPPSPFAAATR